MTGSNVAGKFTGVMYGIFNGAPESALISALFGIGLLAGAAIIFGWTLTIHLAFPLIFSTFVGFGMTAMFPGIMNFCILKQPDNAGAITGAVQFVQFVLSAIGILLGQQASESIGNGPLFTILGVVLYISLIPGVIVVRYKLTANYLFKEETVSKTEQLSEETQSH